MVALRKSRREVVQINQEIVHILLRKLVLPGSLSYWASGALGSLMTELDGTEGKQGHWAAWNFQPLLARVTGASSWGLDSGQSLKPS